MSAKILWFTGLSGSGKTTLANKLKLYLKKKGKKVKILDGDIYRKKNKKKKKFDKINILKNNLSIINHVKSILNNYEFIIISVISPLIRTRKYARKFFKNDYLEFHVFCKIKTLEERDTKGLYKKARLKIIKDLIGYNSKIKYQKSDYPVIKLNTDKKSELDCLNLICKKIKKYL